MSKSNGEYMTAGAVLAALPFASTYYWIQRQAAKGLFPSAIRVSPRKRLYRRAEVMEWISSKFKADNHIAAPSEKPSRPERAKRRRAHRS